MAEKKLLDRALIRVTHYSILPEQTYQPCTEQGCAYWNV
jgi:hypothetical protein